LTAVAEKMREIVRLNRTDDSENNAFVEGQYYG